MPYVDCYFEGDIKLTSKLKVGRPKRDRNVNRAQRKARKKAR